MATPISPDGNDNAPPNKRPRRSEPPFNSNELVLSLRRVDAILQFLCKATGKATVSRTTLQAALPGNEQQKQQVIQHIPELVKRGVIHCVKDEIGFPPPPSLADNTTVEKAQVTKSIGTLHGCTKTAAKRRLAALNRSLKNNSEVNGEDSNESSPKETNDTASMMDDEKLPATPLTSIPQKEWAASPEVESDGNAEQEEVLEEEKQARHALESLLNFSPREGKESQLQANDQMTYILPKQASYAGSNAERTSRYASLSPNISEQVPSSLLDAFGLEREGSVNGRRLYRHQAAAIDSAMRDKHTLVCTGTGSGKSLCFLLPVMAAAMKDPHTCSLLMFPTKALAQDQLTKLEKIIRDNPALQQLVRPGVIDGDIPHQHRASIAESCNIILTNPDTLHSAILPGWKRTYRPLLERVKYIVIDETHTYEGVFGAHVAMVLSRLMRLCAVCSLSRTSQDDRSNDPPQMMLPSFLACSATMSHPEHHFRLLCPISKDSELTVLTADDDGSPRSAKHFFVWNPPIMNTNGTSTEFVTISKSRKQPAETIKGSAPAKLSTDRDSDYMNSIDVEGSLESLSCGAPLSKGETQFYRRHAADETALLVAKAVKNNVRCIAFCKTRSLVEWVYERAISELRSDPATEHLACRVESYRGGYAVEERRLIEQRLFKNELIAVVGTSALELGVDIGGIDCTFHCGYPSSYSSLLQQAGRAGRGSSRLNVPSLAIMVCFNSPAEQHLWRNPRNLLGRAVSIPTAVPLSVGLLEGHLLCAGEEYPLTSRDPVSSLLSQSVESASQNILLNDYDLLGSEAQYKEALGVLVSVGSLVEEIVPVSCNGCSGLMKVFKTHPVKHPVVFSYLIFRLAETTESSHLWLSLSRKSIQKPWTRVSLRSIEPINYSIVDASHPLQGGRMDAVVDNKAVLDSIPYSRVFYHAFPGAVITHRGRRYKVHSMTRPPAFAASASAGYRSSCNLAAFAKPTSVRYSTRPLSGLKITIVKQMERIDSSCVSRRADRSEMAALPVSPDATSLESGSLAGSGIVTVKRTVHGYKKLSPVTRVELSRTEISLPPMEYDTYGLWIDTEATTLSPVVKEYDAGVHALSHALLAVAPLFVPCASSDLDCDHRTFACSRVMLFDSRAGGAGTCSQLWKYLFMPDGLLKAALTLLQDCSSCSMDSDYQGGCPSCIQSGRCLNFNQDLSRRAGVLIAKRMLDRIKETALYKKNSILFGGEEAGKGETQAAASPEKTTPRRKARATALRDAKKLKSARERQIVVGRPTWPLDEVGREHGRVEKAD